MAVPTIGAKGCISVQAPFDTLVSPTRMYQVYSIRLIQDMIGNNEDPLNEIYIPVGLTSVEYNQDLDDRVSIITFIGDGNEVLHIPESYVNSYPSVNGVIYQSKAIAINIGPIPENEDINYLITEIRDLIHSHTGITAEGEIIANSAKTKVSYADHDTIMTARNAAKTLYMGYRQRYIDLLAQLGSYSAQITSLECVIENQCCGRDCGTPGSINLIEDTPLRLCYQTGMDIESPETLFAFKQFHSGVSDCMDTGPVYNPTIPEDVFPTDVELFLHEQHGPCMEGSAEEIFYNNLV